MRRGEREDRGAIVRILSEQMAPGSVRRVHHLRPQAPIPGVVVFPIPRVTMLIRGRSKALASMHDGVQELELAPGDVIYIAPHAWITWVERAVGAGLGFVFWPDHTRYIYSDDLEGKAIPGERISFHSGWAIGREGRLALDALEVLSSKDNAPPHASRLLTETVIDICRHQARTETGRHATQSTHKWLQIRGYITEHFTEPLDRTAVAAAYSVHPNYVSQLFRRHARESFTAFVTRLRLDRAKQLLGQTTATVAEVAAQSGFSTPEYFHLTFRRKVGVSPGQYRIRANAEFSDSK